MTLCPPLREPMRKVQNNRSKAKLLGFELCGDNSTNFFRQKMDKILYDSKSD